MKWPHVRLTLSNAIIHASSLLLALCMPKVVSAQGIEFIHDWDEALRLAKKHNKPIFVDAYASWCGPCKRLAKRIFPLPEVGKFFNQHFINVKLDMEKPEGRPFRQKYPVRVFPTLYFIDPNGEVLHMVRGAPRTAEALINQARIAVERFNPAEDLMKKFEQGEDDPDFLLQLVQALRESDQPTGKVVYAYLRAVPNISTERDYRFIYEATGDCDSKAFELYSQHAKHIKALVGEEAFKQRTLEACAKTVRKAIEYQNTDLLHQAINAAKDLLGKEAEPHTYHWQLDYYARTKNPSGFLKVADSYFRKYTKDNLHRQYLLAKRVHSAFPNDKNALKSALKYLKSPLKKSGRPEYLHLAATIYKELGNAQKAKALAQQALQLASEYGEKIAPYQQFLQGLK